NPAGAPDKAVSKCSTQPKLRAAGTLFFSRSRTRKCQLFMQNKSLRGCDRGKRCFLRMGLQFITARLSRVKMSMLSWSPRKVWDRWCAENLSKDVAPRG